MGAKYTSTTPSGYNNSPPPDDGSTGASNLISWSGIKTKLGDPLNTWASAVNSALVAALNIAVRQITAADSTVAGDHMRTVEIAPTVSNTVTVSLGDAATMTTNYIVAVKNSSNLNQIISRATSGDTIDGVARNITIPSGASYNFIVNSGANGYLLQSSYDESEPTLCEGRLTLSTGVAVPTADVFSAGTVFFTPFRGNRISLFDGFRWRKYIFTEVSATCPNVSSTVHDAFLYDNAGTLTLDFTAWSNDTTRATALTTQDGVLVKSGATGRRYLGTFRTTGLPGQIEDSAAKRYIWNYHNRLQRTMRGAKETTDSWSYTTAAFRQANANTANQVDYVMGVLEEEIQIDVYGISQNNTANIDSAVGIGIDSTSTNSAQIMSPGASNSTGRTGMYARYNGFPGIGRHVAAWLEYSTATGITTWFGDSGTVTFQSGIVGYLRG